MTETPKDKALQILKEQIKKTKAQIEPAVLKKAKDALEGKPRSEESEPYNKKNAAEAIALFLKGAPEAKKKIMALLRKELN
jgi:hypothetical protein